MVGAKAFRNSLSLNPFSSDPQSHNKYEKNCLGLKAEVYLKNEYHLTSYKGIGNVQYRDALDNRTA